MVKRSGVREGQLQGKGRKERKGEKCIDAEGRTRKARGRESEGI